jgi:outer membrane lipoprotein-sorting protein
MMSPLRSILSSAPLAALLALGAACASTPRAPTTAVDATQAVSTSSVVARLRDAAAARTTLRAEGRVTYFGEGGRIRAGLVVVAERPGRLRVETLSPLEQPLEVLTTDGARLWWLSQGVLHEGPATPENLSRLLPVALYPEDLVELLLGGLPGPDRIGRASFAPTDGPRRGVLTLELPAGRSARLDVDVDAARVERWTLASAAGPEWVVELRDHVALPAGGELARTLLIRDLRRDDQVDIKLRDVELGRPVDPALFRLDPPPGTTIVALPSPGVPLGAP